MDMAAVADHALTSSRLGRALHEEIGPVDFLSLLENHAGTRLYVPVRGGGYLVPGISAEASAKLSENYGALYLRIPLCREYRAAIYRARGLTASQIAVKLGITEPAVDRYLASWKRAHAGDPRKLRRQSGL